MWGEKNRIQPFEQWYICFWKWTEKFFFFHFNFFSYIYIDGYLWVRVKISNSQILEMANISNLKINER